MTLVSRQSEKNKFICTIKYISYNLIIFQCVPTICLYFTLRYKITIISQMQPHSRPGFVYFFSLCPLITKEHL